ncbi:MAG: glutathione S-transferase N-terminal domain-containing protein [Planctomycetota bacterium]|nr:glutathione S-transferase N-terminal domain-containing protein [Planctomycetota bacterium]
MIQLYLDPGCPFCVRVTEHFAKRSIPYEPLEFSVYEDSDLRRELIARGGKSQVPYLYDPDRAVGMYESADIIDYVDRHYGG